MLFSSSTRARTCAFSARFSRKDPLDFGLHAAPGQAADAVNDVDQQVVDEELDGAADQREQW